MAQRINSAVGLMITVLVGTMWCAYVFGAIALISLPDNIPSTQLLIRWISSSFLQLVLLPIIILGQNIQSRAADARATKTFEEVEDARNKIEHAIDAARHPYRRRPARRRRCHHRRHQRQGGSERRLRLTTRVQVPSRAPSSSGGAGAGSTRVVTWLAWLNWRRDGRVAQATTRVTTSTAAAAMKARA